VRARHRLRTPESASHSCLDALLDHGALELRKHAQHAEHGATAWRGGVKALLMQEKFDLD
jgi:hypothetical protein